jgi:hypothetical protein
MISLLQSAVITAGITQNRYALPLRSPREEVAGQCDSPQESVVVKPTAALFAGREATLEKLVGSAAT